MLPRTPVHVDNLEIPAIASVGLLVQFWTTRF